MIAILLCRRCTTDRSRPSTTAATTTTRTAARCRAPPRTRCAASRGPAQSTTTAPPSPTASTVASEPRRRPPRRPLTVGSPLHHCVPCFDQKSHTEPFCSLKTLIPRVFSFLSGFHFQIINLSALADTWLALSTNLLRRFKSKNTIFSKFGFHCYQFFSKRKLFLWNIFNYFFHLLFQKLIINNRLWQFFALTRYLCYTSLKQTE